MSPARAQLAQIAAVTGHSLKSVSEIVEHYLVSTGDMAREAFKARLKTAGIGQRRKVGSFSTEI